MRIPSGAHVKGDKLRPQNFRTHSFHLFGKDITIGGMAGLHNNHRKKAALRYLKRTEKRVVLIGMHEEFNFTATANRHRLEYHHFPVDDFMSTPVPPAVYDAIYSVVKKATAEGKQLTISCGAGNGRTGTALACLKLRELLEKAARENPLILIESPSNSTRVTIPFGGDAGLSSDTAPCTPFVKAAVERVRNQRSAPDNSGLNSVETPNDIATLIVYEAHLRREILAEFKAEKREKKVKASACNKILRQIKSLATIGDNDVIMNKFISEQRCAIDRADDLGKISRIHDSLLTTLNQIEQDTSVQKIKEKIEALRKKTGPNNHTKKRKADLIEQAMSIVPVIHRHDLMKAETEEAIHLQRMLGFKHFWRRTKGIVSDLMEALQKRSFTAARETQSNTPRTTTDLDVSTIADGTFSATTGSSATKISLLLADEAPTAARQLAEALYRCRPPTVKTMPLLATLPESTQSIEHVNVSFHEERRGYIAFYV